MFIMMLLFWFSLLTAKPMPYPPTDDNPPPKIEDSEKGQPIRKGTIDYEMIVDLLD